MKSTLSIAALFCLIAVILGAMAAHGLKPLLSEQAMESFQTGVRYQFYHGLALFGLFFLKPWSHKLLSWTKRLWLLGCLLFSGSIYGLTLLPLVGVNAKLLGPITPIGGTLMIAGWICLLIYSLKLPKDEL